MRKKTTWILDRKLSIDKLVSSLRKKHGKNRLYWHDYPII